MALDGIEDHGRALFGGALDRSAGADVAIYAAKLGFRVDFDVGFDELAGDFL